MNARHPCTIISESILIKLWAPHSLNRTTEKVLNPLQVASCLVVCHVSCRTRLSCKFRKRVLCWTPLSRKSNWMDYPCLVHQLYCGVRASCRGSSGTGKFNNQDIVLWRAPRKGLQNQQNWGGIIKVLATDGVGRPVCCHLPWLCCCPACLPACPVIAP